VSYIEFKVDENGAFMISIHKRANKTVLTIRRDHVFGISRFIILKDEYIRSVFE
jgi:hypothetical protein